MGNLELLESLISDQPQAVKRTQTARKAALRGADLTRRLLAFSRKEELRPSPTHLEETINNVIELARRTIGPEIKIVMDCKELPLVYVDAPRLENALLNLAVNSRDAMPKGGTITFSAQIVDVDASYPAVASGELQAGHYACVSVTDTGEGMTKDIMERAFEPFFTTKSRERGTGLGLAMVYGFVKQTGGITRIYSEPGYGTRVSLYLPILEPCLEKTNDRPQRMTSFQSTGKVLVVDDEPDLLEIAAAYLQEMGFTVIQAVDAKSALDAYSRERDIELLITDVIMPGSTNGVELASQIRMLNPGIGIIYSSGFPADALNERSRRTIDGPLLHKPFERAALEAAIRNVMK